MDGFSREQGVEIFLSKDFGGPVTWTHIYDDNSKIRRRIIEKPYEISTAIDYVNGKKTAESKWSGGGLKQAEIYDDNGKVIKTLERKYCDNNLATITEILPDSSKKITYCSAPVGKYDPASSYKIIDDAPKEIIHKDAKGEIIKSLIYSDSYKFNADLDIQTKDINCFISIAFNEKRYDENHPPSFHMFDPAGKTTCSQVHACINKDGNNAVIEAYSKEQLKELEKAVMLALKEAKKENFATFPYEKAEDYLSKIFNSAA